MKKVSLVLLALLFSASMASAESFTVKAQNKGVDANSKQTIVKSIVTTKTHAKILGPNITSGDVDVHRNTINNTVFGAKAFHSVDVDIDCTDCDDKFYETVEVTAVNHGELLTETTTFSTMGDVSKNQINGAVIGASAGGTYTTSNPNGSNAPSGNSPDTTFTVLATNHGTDNNGDPTKIISEVKTYTTSEILASGTPAPATFIGGDVDDNTITNVAYGADAFMTVEVDVDCECSGKFYEDVKVDAINYGDVIALTDTFSDVGSVRHNRISAQAIGANASGSYANLNPSAP